MKAGRDLVEGKKDIFTVRAELLRDDKGSHLCLKLWDPDEFEVYEREVSLELI